MAENCVKGTISEITETHFKVSLESESNCHSCGFNNYCSNKIIEFEKNRFPGNYKTGQRVKVEFEKVIQASLIVYFVPIIFFFAGIAVSKYFFDVQNELFLFINAIIATAVSFLIINIISKKIADKEFKVNIKFIN